MDRTNVKLSCDPVREESLSWRYLAENRREQSRFNVLERHIKRQRQLSLRSQSSKIVEFQTRLAKYDRLRMAQGSRNTVLTALCTRRQRPTTYYIARPGRSSCVRSRMTDANELAKLTAGLFTHNQSHTRENINKINANPPTLVNRSKPSADLKTDYHLVACVRPKSSSSLQLESPRNQTLGEKRSGSAKSENREKNSVGFHREGRLLLLNRRVERAQYTGVEGDLATDCGLLTVFLEPINMSDHVDSGIIQHWTEMKLSNSEENIVVKDRLRVDESMRPRANSDPAASKAELHVHFDLPEITVDDFSEELDHLKEKANSSEGAFFVFTSPPRRRANTCPEKYFRNDDRPPTPPPGGVRRVHHRNGIVRNPPKISFIHHKLSKVVEDTSDVLRETSVSKDHNENIETNSCDKDRKSYKTSHLCDDSHTNKGDSDSLNKSDTNKASQQKEISPKRQSVPKVSSLNEQHKVHHRKATVLSA